MTGWELVTHIIPWLIALGSLSFTIIVQAKKTRKEELKEAKECTIETTRIITGIDSIKDMVSESRRDIKDIRGDINGLKDRVTTLETKFEDFEKAE